LELTRFACPDFFSMYCCECLKEIIRCVSRANLMKCLWCEEIGRQKMVMEVVMMFKVRVEFLEVRPSMIVNRLEELFDKRLNCN
jgi:hypothetical protein